MPTAPSWRPPPGLALLALAGSTLIAPALRAQDQAPAKPADPPPAEAKPVEKAAEAKAAEAKPAEKEAQPEEGSSRRRRGGGGGDSAEKPKEGDAPKEAAPIVPVDTSEIVGYDDPQGFAGFSLNVPKRVFSPEPLIATPDRWRIGWPSWDRYGRATSADEGLGMSSTRSDVAYTRGSILNPYDRNVLKGDYPVIGDDIFFTFGAVSDSLYLYRKNVTPSGNAAQENSSFQQFKDGRGSFFNQNFFLAFELTHGYTSFRPIDWAIKVVPAFNMNYLRVKENVVSVDPLAGDERYDTFETLQEALVDLHMGDVSEYFDVISLKIGRQLFNSDFRGWIFNDLSDGARLTGNAMANRLQYNLALFNTPEKDTNSGLNELNWRDQQVLIANAYFQDCFVPGYTVQGSFHWNHDSSNERFDTNGFPVRPDLAGDFLVRDENVYYLGVASDGHIGRINVDTAAYYAFGEDDHNPIAGRQVDISAYMAALELSVDFDWFRPKVSFLYASGDSNPTDDTGGGFDSIADDPQFAGGPSSFYQNQSVRIFGVGLNQGRSFFNTLKSSKAEGQSNFVNPGTILFNAGFDAEITPQLRASFNANYLLFSDTASLEFLTNQFGIDQELGSEIDLLLQYRPLLNNNVIFTISGSMFFPGQGFVDVYGQNDTLFQMFAGVTLTY